MSPTSTLPSAADALTALNAYQMPSSSDLLSQAQQQYGVNDLQSKVSALRGLTSNLTSSIAAVDPNVTGQTAGSLVTEGQRGALVDRERAPLVSQLGTANTSEAQASDDYNTAEGNAKDAAAGKEADATAKYNQLKDTYDAANSREQAAAQLAEQQSEEAEKVREANLTAANNTDVAHIEYPSAATTPTSSNASSSPQAQYQQRAGGGFNFQGPSGEAISAAQYASLTNTPLRSLLQNLANAGDQGAKTALDYVGNDFGINKAKVGNNAQVKSILNSILGGVNKI